MVIGALAAAMVAQIDGSEPKAQIYRYDSGRELRIHSEVRERERALRTLWWIRIAARSETANGTLSKANRGERSKKGGKNGVVFLIL